MSTPTSGEPGARRVGASLLAFEVMERVSRSEEAGDAMTPPGMALNLARFFANLPDDVRVTLTDGSGQSSIDDLWQAFTATQQWRWRH